MAFSIYDRAIVYKQNHSGMARKAMSVVQKRRSSEYQGFDSSNLQTKQFQTLSFGSRNRDQIRFYDKETQLRNVEKGLFQNCYWQHNRSCNLNRYGGYAAYIRRIAQAVIKIKRGAPYPTKWAKGLPPTSPGRCGP